MKNIKHGKCFENLIYYKVVIHGRFDQERGLSTVRYLRVCFYCE